MLVVQNVPQATIVPWWWSTESWGKLQVYVEPGARYEHLAKTPINAYSSGYMEWESFERYQIHHLEEFGGRVPVDVREVQLPDGRVEEVYKVLDVFYEIPE